MAHDSLLLTMADITRYDIITQLTKQEIGMSEAAAKLHLSVRHVRRLRTKVREHGAAGLAHGNRGRTSNRKTPEDITSTATKILEEQYADFKPGFAAEKLRERHEIILSRETVRTLMIKSGLWKPHLRKQNRQYHSWRPRKDTEGEMLQFDGSYHLWLEDRAPELCLLAAIDDATGNITRMEFAANEGVESVFVFWKTYAEDRGIPASIYLDSYSTYKINHKAAVDNSELLTQFQRVAKELGMKLITAHSPQAKGRIERLFETLQDRLVKELRLRGISDATSANRYLRDEFIPDFNRRFGVVAAKPGDCHRKLTEQERALLPATFSVQSSRVVLNDFTVRFKNQWLQLAPDQPKTVCRKDAVLMEERLDGSLYMRFKQSYLVFKILPGRPPKPRVRVTALVPSRSPWKPSADHPWRTAFVPEKKIPAPVLKT
ncbi:MAG: ISNCY family transposase [Candidatus Binatota bacterium]